MFVCVRLSDNALLPLSQRILITNAKLSFLPIHFQ